MSVPLKSIALGAAALLGLVSFVRSAEDVAIPKPSSEAAEALVAPEFAKHLDVDAAAAAFQAEDVEALLAIGQKLGRAERSAGKTNQALPAVAFYRMAIHIGRNNNDLKKLDQLEALIGAANHLSKTDQQQLLADLSLARKFSGASRKINAGPGLKPNQVSAEAIVLYNAFAREMRITQEYGTEEGLEQLVDSIGQLRELHPKQRDHLATMAKAALVAIRERGKPDSPPAALAAVSRSVTSGLRILGPGEVPLNGATSLVVISAGGASAKSEQLHFRSSAGVQVPDKLAWTGKPLVIPATIKAAPGTPVFVSVGLNDKADSLTWNAQAARE